MAYMSSNDQRPVCPAQHQVLVHREVGEDVAVLGHVADAQVRDLVRLLAQGLLALPLDRAGAVDHAHDGLGGR
jgi:hypothetical protein